MLGTERRGRWFVVVLALVVVAWSGCTMSGEDADVERESEPGAPEQAPGGDAAPGERPDDEPLGPDDPIVRAEDFLAAFRLGSEGEDITPESVAFLDYVSRRWSRPQVADPDSARAALRSSDDFAGLARLFDPEIEIPADEAAELVPPLGAALFCDRHGFPSGYASLLRSHVESGGYLATHVLLALGIAGELGCEVPDADEIRAAAVDTVASELAATEDVTDLSVQQIAFLDYVGSLDRVDPVWEERLVRSQLPDGGWPEDPTSEFGRWHTAGPAWWSLLAFSDPGDRTTGMVAGP